MSLSTSIIKYYTITSIVNTIILGDSTVELTKIPSESVDGAIFDPPYGVNYDDDHYDDSENYVFSVFGIWLREIARILKNGSHCYIFVPTEWLDRWIIEVRKYLTYKQVIATQCYVNNRFKQGNVFCNDAQYIIFAHKGKGRNFNLVDWIPTSYEWLHDQRNTNKKPFTYLYPSYIYYDLVRANIKANEQIKRRHPNEKNPYLIQKFIEMSTNENEIVLDAFFGSGTTGIAALKSKRKFIGIEQNGEYHNLGIQRIQKYLKKQQIHFNNSLDGILQRLGR